MKSIKSFYFQNARYLAADAKGNEVYMNLNYKDGVFDLEVVRMVDQGMEKLKKEAMIAAKGLLMKKHNVNMVERLEKLMVSSD